MLSTINRSEMAFFIKVPLGGANPPSNWPNSVIQKNSQAGITLEQGLLPNDSGYLAAISGKTISQADNNYKANT